MSSSESVPSLYEPAERTIEVLARVFAYTQQTGRRPTAREVSLPSHEVNALVHRGLLRRYTPGLIGVSESGYERLLMAKRATPPPCDSVPPPSDTVDHDFFVESLRG